MSIQLKPNMMQRMTTSRLWGAMLLLSCAFGLAACGDEVSFDASTEAPKVGTSLIAFQYHHDDKGILRERLADSTVVTVLPTLTTYLGKGNVVPFALAMDDTTRPGIPQRDTIYAHYEPNGDVSVRYEGYTISAPGINRSVRIPDSWIVLPFGGKVDTGHVLKDTSYLIDMGNANVPGRVEVMTTQQFIGPAVLVTELGPLNVLGVKVHHVTTLLNNETRSVGVVDVTYHYSPKLGAIVKYDEVSLIGTGSATSLRELSHRGWQTSFYTLVK
jgi:hypothetical protein